MLRNKVLSLLTCVVLAWPAAAQADIVTDWNDTLCTRSIADAVEAQSGRPDSRDGHDERRRSTTSFRRSIARTHRSRSIRSPPAASWMPPFRRPPIGCLSDMYPEHAGDAWTARWQRDSARLPMEPGKNGRHRSGELCRPALHRRPAERRLESAGCVHADRWTRPLEHGSDGRSRRSKKAGDRTGAPSLRGPCPIPTTSTRDAVQTCRLEHPAEYATRSTK